MFFKNILCQDVTVAMTYWKSILEKNKAVIMIHSTLVQKHTV